MAGTEKSVVQVPIYHRIQEMGECMDVCKLAVVFCSLDARGVLVLPC